MISNIYVCVVCVVYVVNVVYLVNVAKVRYTRFTRFTLYTPGGLVNLGVNVGFEVLYRSVYDGFTACPSAGYLSFPIEPEYRPGRSTDQDHRKNAAKLARFMHEKGVKNSMKSADNGYKKRALGFANCIYHNHEIQNPYFLHNNRLIQMINDLQGGFENADNFSFV